MRTSVESARQEWQDGHARLEAHARDPVRYARLLAQVEVLTEELRRRVGQTFTLAELADIYPDAERWSRQTVTEHAAESGPPNDLAIVEGAAFHLYARGATDFTP